MPSVDWEGLLFIPEQSRVKALVRTVDLKRRSLNLSMLMASADDIGEFGAVNKAVVSF